MNKQEIEKDIEILKYYEAQPYFLEKDMPALDAFRRAISTLEHQLTNDWIPVSERLPDDDNPVEITARRKEGVRGYFVYKAHYVAPRTKTTEDYAWEDMNVDCEYDEENDCFWVPECWYEDNAISDNGNYILNYEFDILAWKQLPEPYKEERIE